MAWSSAWSIWAWPSASVFGWPQVMVPRQMALTRRSVRPRRRYSMAGSRGMRPAGGRETSKEEGEDAGVGIEATAANLSVGEESDKRKIAELRADQLQLGGVRPEEVRPAGDAGDIDAAFDGAGIAAGLAGQPVEHPLEIDDRRRAIAADEADRLAGRDLRADRQTVARPGAIGAI